MLRNMYHTLKLTVSKLSERNTVKIHRYNPAAHIWRCNNGNCSRSTLVGNTRRNIPQISCQQGIGMDAEIFEKNTQYVSMDIKTLCYLCVNVAVKCI